MTWRDRYLDASFRGVSFLVQASTTTVGQRRAVYDLPFDEQGAAAVDLGRRARRYSITALLVGPDYDRARDKLIAALEAPGYGLLVHPYLGAVQVHPASEIQIHESTDQGGMCEVSFEAVQARATAGPAVSRDTKTLVKRRALAVQAAARASMASDFNLQGVRDFVARVNLDSLDRVLQDIRQLNSTITSVLAVPGRFGAQIDGISRELATLIYSPGELFDALSDTLATIVHSAVTVSDAAAGVTRSDGGTAAIVNAVSFSSAALARALEAGAQLGASPDPTGATPEATRMRANHAALLHTTRASALASVADTATETTWDSSTRARAMRDALTEALAVSTETLIAGYEMSAQLLVSVQDLRAAVYEHLTAAELDPLVRYTPAQHVSSAALAYERYGDATRAGEIEALNRPAHPGFLSGPLEVLAK